MTGRDRRGKRIIVWPSYIDGALSKREGRRIARIKSVKKPAIDEIVLAAQLLNLNPEVEQARYPRRWWEARARVVVDRITSKRRILELLALKIAELRASKT